jgi:hypothetical protein
MCVGLSRVQLCKVHHLRCVAVAAPIPITHTPTHSHPHVTSCSAILVERNWGSQGAASDGTDVSCLRLLDWSGSRTAGSNLLASLLASTFQRVLPAHPLFTDFRCRQAMRAVLMVGETRRRLRRQPCGRRE